MSKGRYYFDVVWMVGGPLQVPYIINTYGRANKENG